MTEDRLDDEPTARTPFSALQPTRSRRRLAVASFLLAIAAAVGIFLAEISRWRIVSDVVDGLAASSEIRDADGRFFGSTRNPPEQFLIDEVGNCV